MGYVMPMRASNRTNQPQQEIRDMTTKKQMVYFEGAEIALYHTPEGLEAYCEGCREGTDQTDANAVVNLCASIARRAKAYKPTPAPRPTYAEKEGLT